MFPENTIDYESIIEEEAKPIGKSFLFDYEKREFVIVDGKVKEISDSEAIKQWVTMLLMTSAGKYKIYDDDFGVYFDNYIGYKKSKLGFVKSELKREIEEKIILNKAISGIKSFECTLENDRLLVKFTVILRTEEEVGVSQIV